MVVERNSVTTIAERVTEMRERHGWSKNELARRADDRGVDGLTD
jgi:ribosome-binding protein aMBF1 (putative translation factor)